MKDNTVEEKVERNEEVQAIIDRMPTRSATYAIILTLLLAGAIVTLGFIIKYPETVDGQISITARLAPVRLVANTSGKLHLLVNSNSLKNSIYYEISSFQILFLHEFRSFKKYKSNIIACPKEHLQFPGSKYHKLQKEYPALYTISILICIAIFAYFG